MLTAMTGLRRAREVVEDSAAKVVSAAQDTRSALVAVSVVAVVALVLSFVAVIVSARKVRTA